MPKLCPTCGAEAPDQFRFCGFCATSLDIVPAEPAGEPAEARSARRLVTILFADLTNYTHAAARIDPEEIFLAIRRTLELLSQPVAHFGGRIDRYVGDGFLATFGLPEAHEDDAVRAVLTALEMQRAMPALRQEAEQGLGWDVQLRIGVNLGPVISGQLDTGAVRDASVFGHAVNLAHRLQQAARPGTVLVSDAVYRLTRSYFEYRDPAILHLKGLDAPVVAYEVIGQRSAPLPHRGLTGRPTPLVGRSTESTALLSALQRLKIERQGLIAIIAGEPGIGKTRLVEEVLAPLANHFTIVRAAGSPTETTSYGLVAHLVENLVGIAPDDSSAVRQQRLETWLAPSGTLLRDIGPVLHSLVSGPTSRDHLIGDPQQDQRRIYAALRRLIAWQTRRRATLLVLDDLQWADPSSLAAIAHAADLVYESPLGIIGMGRPDVRAHLPPALAQPHPAHPASFLNFSLGPLSPADSDRLLNHLLNDVEAPAELIQRVAERSSGNPLLMEEVVRMLLDQDVIRKTDAGWEVAPQWVEAVEQVPETVNGLILSRYDRLAPAYKRLLDAAAVLGHSFPLPLLQSVTAQAEPELRRELDTLEQSDFLRRASGSGQPVYVFRHWLMQEAIYQTILQKERRALHLRAAQVIQQMAEGLAVDAAARVGYHLERAGSRQAIGYLMQAARQAAERYANEEAVAYYQRVQALLDQHGARQEEAVDVALGLTELLARTGQPDAARETLERARSLSLGQPRPGYRLADVLFQLGLVKSRQGQHAEARAAFEAAAEHLRERAQRTSEAAEHTVSLSDIEREIGWVMLAQGSLVEARTRAESALRLALQSSDLTAAGSAHNLLGGCHYWAGQLSESVASSLRALAIREQLGDVWGSAATQTNLGGLYYKLGQWAQAESFLRQAIFVQQEIGDYHGLGASWNVLGLLLLDSGRFEEALHSMNQAIIALRGQEQGPAVALRHLNRGQVWLRLGVPTWAIADLQRSLEAAAQVRNDDLRAMALANLVEARLLENDLAQARQHLHEAELLADTSGSLETRAEIVRARSLLSRAESNWDDALDANRQAQDLFRQIGNRYELARRQIEAAEIRLARSEDRAQNGHISGPVREALQTFRQLHAQADILRAETLLSRLSTGLAGGERAAVLVHLRLQMPDLAGESEARQEELADLFNRLAGVLEKTGRERGAQVTRSVSSLSFIFSGPAVELSEALVQQALQASLEALDAASRLTRASRRQQGLEIELSLGLASGRWTAPATGDQPGAEARAAAIFASASPAGRQAQAAAALAGVNQIALTGDLSQLARADYELEPVAEAEADPRLVAPVYRVARVRPEARLARTLPGSTPHLVGREAELSALTGWIDRLRREGRGLVCYLEAEAGMGKTRLLEQVLGYAQPDLLCLVGKCESFRAGMSYWPLVNILEQADLPGSSALAQAPLAHLHATLGGLLGLRAAEEADAQLLRNLPPAGLRQEIFARLRAWLLQAAAQRPVLLVIEDIHWLDLSSLDLVDYLLPLTLEAPVALMLVARAEMPGPHRSLVRKAEKLCQDRYLPITFGNLTAAETRSLVVGLLGSPQPPEAVWPLLQPFAGHPLSLEEALRFMVESGWLREANGDWQLAASHENDQAGTGRRIPVTFKDLLLRRLELLPSETLHVLQAAAVLGESFDHTVLSHVVGGPAVARRLSELVERGWLLPASPENPLLFRFKHTLTRETIYATLLTSKLRVLHQRAGEALEALYPEAQVENVELLAYHFGHSSLREKALGYLVRAGQIAAARHALAESLSYYQSAREIVTELSAHGSPPALRLQVSLGLGLTDVRLAQGDPASAAAEAESVLGLMNAAELPAELRAGAWRRLATARRRLGDFQQALQHFQTARQVLVAEREAHPAVSGEAALPGLPGGPVEREGWQIELGLAQTLFDMRENQRARAQAEYVLRGVDRRQHPELAAETLNLLGGMAYRQGELDTAAQLVRDSLAIYQAYGNRSGAAAVYANLGVLAANRQDVEAAYDNFSLSLTLREALGDSQGIAITRNNLGQLERNRGRLGEAIQHLTIAAERARHAELNPLLAQCLANLGHALALTGQRAAALGALDEAEVVCQNVGLKNILCEVWWKRAECLVEGAESDLPAAERAAQNALALADELNSSDLRSEARRVLSRVYRRQGQTELALAHAGEAWRARSGDPNPVIRARFAAEQALALWAAGQPAAARSLFEGHVNPVELPESELTRREVTAALASV